MGGPRVSLHDVGDAPLITYRPVDPSTVPPTPIDGTVTASLTDPAGAVTPLTITHADVGEYSVSPVLAVAGSWQVRFEMTSPAVDVEQVTVVALPAGSMHPGWEPSLVQVAAHIPTRTRAVGVDNEYLMTFTEDTTPTGDAAAEIIGHACAWVAGAVGSPVADAAYPICQVASALWAAYWIEIGYPERNADVEVYERLRRDAEMTTKAAASVNAAAGGASSVDPDDPGTTVLYAFPDPPPYADYAYLN